MRILIIFCFICILVGCDKSTSFHKLEHMYFVHHNETSGNQISEYIVMENPPKILDSLALVINNYNDTTLNYHSLDTMNVYYYQRFFYRKTRSMPIDYKEDHSFISDIIADHLDDLIAVVKKDKNNKWTFKLKTHNNPDEWKKFKVARNLNIIVE